MTARQPVEIHRADLYARVWAAPVRKVAAELGISDVGLAKICDKLGVPRPPRGHWAKVRHRGKTTRPRLPARAQGQPESVVLEVRRAAPPQHRRPPRPTPPEVPLPRKGARRHALVRLTDDALGRSGWTNREGLLHPRHESGALDVVVSAAARSRALSLLDALVNALEGRGHRVQVDSSRRQYDRPPTFAVVRSQQVHFRLRELCRQRPREPEAWERRWHPEREHAYTELAPSGDLQFELSGDFHQGVRKLWSDRSRKGKRLEELLGELVVEFEVGAEQADARQAERLRAEDERRRQEAERVQLRRRRAHREALLEDLGGMADAWSRAEHLRAFVDAARACVDRAGVSGPDVDAWFEWAAAAASDTDPLSHPERIAKRLEPPGEPSPAQE